MTTEDTRNHDSGEMELFEGESDTKLYALGVVLAAVYGMSALVPISGFIVASGVVAQISLTIVIAPLFGVLLGPVKGGLFGLIGGLITAFLSMVVPSVVLIVPTVVLGPMVSGFLTGLCLNEEDSGPGGLITAAYLVVIMALYLIPNSAAWWFMLPYALAAFTALALQFTGFRFDRTEKKSLLYILPLTLIGTITDFSMMTMGAVYIAGIPAEVFGFVIFPAMLVERTVATIVSAVAAGTVLYTFRDQLW